MTYILLGQGFLIPLTSPGEVSALKWFAYLPTVWLASWRIRLNCFFILYFLRSHLWGGNIPHYFFQYIGPSSTGEQRKIQSAIFSFPHCKLPGLNTYSRITYFRIYFLHLNLPNSLRRDAGPLHRGHAQAESDSSDKKRVRSNAVWEM